MLKSSCFRHNSKSESISQSSCIFLLQIRFNFAKVNIDFDRERRRAERCSQDCLIANGGTQNGLQPLGSFLALSIGLSSLGSFTNLDGIHG
jgi:hypothetical protein